MTLYPRCAPALIVLVMVAMTLWGCGRRDSGEEAIVAARAQDAAERPLELAAAASLAEVARDLAAGWEKRTGIPVRVRLAGSSTLARQIRAGAPADLFLSASAQWVDGLDVLARRAWLGNRLAVVVLDEAGSLRAAPDTPRPAAPDTAAGVAAWLADLDSLVLAEPGVPVGRSAEAALASLGVALPARVVRGAHARDVLSKVSQGAARAGIVYLTDAALDDEVSVLAVLPEECHAPIRYEVALIDESARALYDALFDSVDDPWVDALATRHGFSVEADP